MSIINDWLDASTPLKAASESLAARALLAPQDYSMDLPFSHMRQLLISALTAQENEMFEED